jgi:hypothetical protein
LAKEEVEKPKKHEAVIEKQIVSRVFLAISEDHENKIEI